MHCQDTGHRDDLDKFTLDVLETIQTVAEEVLPVPTPSNRAPSIRPGWLDEVKQYKETAYFWHQVWRSAGRPLNTELHSIMKKTRNIYHYQYKKCRKAEEQIKKNKLRLKLCRAQVQLNLSFLKLSRCSLDANLMKLGTT